MVRRADQHDAADLPPRRGQAGIRPCRDRAGIDVTGMRADDRFRYRFAGGRCVPRLRQEQRELALQHVALGGVEASRNGRRWQITVTARAFNPRMRHNDSGGGPDGHPA